eukprot:11876165-Alexandrium_andersonii.AAC.1
MPFLHGCPNGQLALLVVDSVLVLRSCSRTCLHCVNGRKDDSSQRDLRMVAAPDLGDHFQRRPKCFELWDQEAEQARLSE